jgi:predicted amidohydrolase YtcJ
MRINLSLGFVLILILASSCMKSIDCDLVIHNAKIYSMDDGEEVYEAMAIKDGKILELGPERQILNKYSYTESYDAELKPIYPGFIDAHCHFLGYGLSLEQVELKSCTSFEEVIEKLIAYNETKTGDWIEGRGWDHTRWTNQSYPNKKMLDSIFPETPILIRRVDGHAALANQKALDLALIDISTSVNGGHIEVLEGKLTGIVVDNAVDLIREIIPAPNETQIKSALIKAQTNCFQVGLTTVDDAGLKKSEIEHIEELQALGLLKIRIYAMLSDIPENFNHYLVSGPTKTDLLNVRSFKFYGDGALGSRGACLIKPYTDDTSNYGMLLNEEDHFRKYANLLSKKGFQMNTHCIGDSTARMILKIYAEVLMTSNDKRWRIEHAQIINPADFSFFKDYNIIPSVQPTHATSDMRWAVLRVGRERLLNGYAYDKLRKQNGFVALGTDFPIEGISPIETFYAAVARKDKEGNPIAGFQKENALSRLNALKGMTIWAAKSNFEEKEKGSLEEGKFADFIILSNDLMECSESAILNSTVTRTYINGSCVYKN